MSHDNIYIKMESNQIKYFILCQEHRAQLTITVKRYAFNQN